MDELLAIMGEIDIPSAYDHFAEGEAVEWRERSKPCWMSTVFFMTRQRCGSTPRSCMRSCIHSKWRVKTWETKSNIT